MFDGVLKSLYGKNNAAKDVDEVILKAVRDIFHLTPNNYGAISIDAAAENFVTLNNLRGDFLKKFSTIFENYLVKEFFMNVYPFRLSKKSIQINYGVFLTLYKIIELFARIFPDTNENNLVKLISVMATSFDHTPPYHFRNNFNFTAYVKGALHLYKSGFIAVIGRPNVGKSTLINKIIGQKIAIMSDKPQTTRSRIQCILTQDDAQIIFLDTPGIHKPMFKLGEYMLKAAEGTLKEVDGIFFVIDATENFGGGEKYILERLETTTAPVILVINKVDLIDREKILPIISAYSARRNFAAVVPISAVDGTNIDTLIDEAKKFLPEGSKYYPADMVTDQPERLIVAELIREKILHVTEDEVPHSVAVDIEEITPRKNAPTYIRAVIYVERDSQKGIIIGKGGELLKGIGKNSRPEIEMLLGTKVYLDLWVKVKRGWRNSNGAIQNLGLGE